MKWSLVAEKVECRDDEIGNNDFWRPHTLEQCATSCLGVSSMFIFGTNDFGKDRCDVRINGIYLEGCFCYCETSAKPDGTCNMKKHNGYRLYKFDTGKEKILQNVVTQKFFN